MDMSLDDIIASGRKGGSRGGGGGGGNRRAGGGGGIPIRSQRVGTIHLVMIVRCIFHRMSLSFLCSEFVLLFYFQKLGNICWFQSCWFKNCMGIRTKSIEKHGTYELHKMCKINLANGYDMPARL